MEETLWWGLTPRSSTVAAEDMEFGLALQSSRKAGADNPGSFHHGFDRETRDLLPRIKTCPLKRDHFKRKIAFQPIIFWGGYVSFRGLNFAESVCSSRWEMTSSLFTTLATLCLHWVPGLWTGCQRLRKARTRMDKGKSAEMRHVTTIKLL